MTGVGPSAASRRDPARTGPLRSFDDAIVHGTRPCDRPEGARGDVGSSRSGPCRDPGPPPSESSATSPRSSGTRPCAGGSSPTSPRAADAGLLDRRRRRNARRDRAGRSRGPAARRARQTPGARMRELIDDLTDLSLIESGSSCCPGERRSHGARRGDRRGAARGSPEPGRLDPDRKRGRYRGRRRPAEARADSAEPPGQRRQVLAPRRHGWHRVGHGGGGLPSIVVEDEGPGIPAAEQDRIFQRFYQVESSRARRSAPGDGPRPRDREAPRAAPRRRGHGDERARQRQRISRDVSRRPLARDASGREA